RHSSTIFLTSFRARASTPSCASSSRRGARACCSAARTAQSPSGCATWSVASVRRRSERGGEHRTARRGVACRGRPAGARGRRKTALPPRANDPTKGGHGERSMGGRHVREGLSMKRVWKILRSGPISGTALVLVLGAATGCNTNPTKDKPKAEVTEAVAPAAPAPAAASATKYTFSQEGSKLEWVGAKVSAKHDGGF